MKLQSWYIAIRNESFCSCFIFINYEWKTFWSNDLHKIRRRILVEDVNDEKWSSHNIQYNPNLSNITGNLNVVFYLSKEQKGIQYCSIKNELAFHILKLEATPYSEFSIFLSNTILRCYKFDILKVLTNVNGTLEHIFNRSYYHNVFFSLPIQIWEHDSIV